MFITIEGVDGSGKSTQAKLLVEFYQKQKIDVILTREPGGCDVSESIREILLDPSLDISENTELLLMLAARSEHFLKTIKPHLDKNGVVICERFSDSTFAYQGYARGINLDLIKTIDNFATLNVEPDLTLFFDINPDITFTRLENRPEKKDRMELEGVKFQKKVREGFFEIAKKEPSRFRIIDVTNLTIDQVFEKVKANVIL